MKPHFKPIDSASNLFKVELQETRKEFEYPWHYHPELELTYIINGAGIRYVGNSIENFFSDELVLLGPNLPHIWNITESNENTTAIVIYLKPDFCEHHWMSSIEFESIRQLLLAMSKGIIVSKTIALQVKPMLLQMLSASPFDKLMLLMQVLHLLATNTDYRFLCQQEFSTQFNQQDNARINMVYDYIHQNYRRQVTLAEIASKLNMTEEYFSRFFSKTMKKPFFEFLNEYKINKACKLLIETDKQVSEICYASGFESIPFFYRQFKKFKDCQPVSYRQQYQRLFLT